MIGMSLGPYRIVERLGRGGMAAVYKAYQPSLDRYVAVKVLPSHLTDEPGFAERFRREARAVAKLEHPHILPVHDYGQEGERTYIAMRYVEGGTLKDLLGKPLELPLIVDLIGQIAEALDYAHDHGVIHRDVKPSNVLLDRGNWALLTDFGVARMVEATQQLTGTGVGVGTPAYMSPEQGQGKKVDRRSDVYSLGVVLYEMLTGRVPFEAETPLAVVWKHVNEPLPLPRSINPAVPEAVERVVLKAMAKLPEDRFQVAGELEQALRSALRESEMVDAVAEDQKPAREGTREGRIRPASAPWRRRFGWLLLSGVLLASLAVLFSRVAPRVQIAGGRASVTNNGAMASDQTATETPQPATVGIPSTQPIAVAGTAASAASSFICDDPLGCVAVGPGEPIRLRYLLSMSSDLGVDSMRGAEIALDDKGPIHGHEVELLGEDDGCNPDLAREAAVKIAADKSVVAMIGTNCSGTAYAVAPFLSEAGITMVSPSNTRPDLTDPALHVPGYLRVVASDVFQARGAATFVFNQLGFRRSAILYHPGNPYSEGLALMFQEEFEDLGGQVILSATIESGESDMSSALAAVVSESPDLVYLTIFPSEGAALVRQARQIPGLDRTVLMGSDSLWAQEFLAALGDLAEGMYLSASTFDAKQSPAYQSFLAKYQAAYHESPLTPFHAHAYDAMRIILGATERVGIQDADGALHIGRQALREALYATRDFGGLTGVLTCDPNGDCGVPQYGIFQIQAGEFVKLIP